MECNGIDFRVWEPKRLMGQRVHEDGFELTNF